MVKVALAGGSGNVALEVIEALVATGKHEILILSRKDAPGNERRPGVTWTRTNYEDVMQLKEILNGVHTLLSFIETQSDERDMAQRNMIDAAIKAGVKRFAPSEWATSNFDHFPLYKSKAGIREYLREINKHEKILEYCLFIPGLFTNYFAHPYKSAEHFHSFQTHIDFENCRALVLEDSENDRLTLTTVQDLANVVAKAIDYEGEWPDVGGVSGDEISIGELIALGEKVRGKPFAIEKLRREDLEAGVTKSSWLPMVDHPGVPNAEEIAGPLTANMILMISAGALKASDEWNRLLPDYQFTQAGDFLEKMWADYLDGT